MNENRGRLDAVQANKVMPNEILFWFGYLITYLIAYWCLKYQETARNILKTYDIESIVYSYEVLHSLSVKSAIEKIK